MKSLGGVAAILAGFAVWASPAAAATGTQQFHFVFPGDPHEGAVGRVIATGVVTGAGTDRNVGSHTNPDGTVTDLDQITLPGGTITIEDTDTFTDFSLDPRTCVARVNVSGVYDVVGATGRYQGASGEGTFSGTALLVFDRTAAGCSETPRRFFADIRSTGPLSVP